MNRLSTAAANIVTLQKNKPFTTSLVIADGVGLAHRVVIRLVRKYQKDFEEFGLLNFESSINRGTKGLQTEYAVLNEDQATYLITMFKNSDIVRKFKIQLVKAFRKALNDLDYLRKQKSEPAWRIKRDETKTGFKWMNYNLKEQRAAAGKVTKEVHYMNEAKLINGVLSGIYGGVNRDTLPAQDMPYRERKAELERYLTPRLEGGAL